VERLLEAAGFLLMVRQPTPQFLLMRHHDRWDLPKGHAEDNEDLLQTALRETEEETGIRGDSVEVVPDFRWSTQYRVLGKKRGDYDKRVTYFLGFLRDKPEIAVTEHAGHHWWDWPPPAIQPQTIDPLLAAVADYLQGRPEWLSATPAS
jgi:bis(5'-nucleosidyl)-tetraphosphatase